MSPSAALLLCCLRLLSASSVGAEPQEAAGFVALYEPVTDERFLHMRDAVIRDRVLERFVDRLNAGVRIPGRILVSFAECGGVVNAWYYPRSRLIRFCYELADEMAAIQAKRPISRWDAEILSMKGPGTVASKKAKAREKALGAAIVFVLFHEVGHALVDVLDLPVTGREEDAVDQLATILTIADDSDQGQALFAAKFFADTDHVGRTPYSDEHAFGKQRYFNILCWVYGPPAARQGGHLAPLRRDGAEPRAAGGDLAPHRARAALPHRLQLRGQRGLRPLAGPARLLDGALGRGPPASRRPTPAGRCGWPPDTCRADRPRTGRGSWRWLRRRPRALCGSTRTPARGTSRPSGAAYSDERVYRWLLAQRL